MKPYNYARKFLDETEHFDDPLFEDYQKWTCEEKNNKLKDSDFIQEGLKNVRNIRLDVMKGIKYIVPDNCTFGMNIKNKHKFADLIRLPYARTIIEAKFRHDVGKDEDGNQVLGIHKRGYYPEDGVWVPTILILYRHEGATGFIMHVIEKDPVDDRGWVATKHIAILREEDIKRWKTEPGDELTYAIRSLDEKNTPVKSLDDGTHEEFKYLLHQMLECVIEFCIWNNTKNVKAETISSPAKMNKKRIKRGKAAYFTYKILNVHRRAFERSGGTAGMGTGKNAWHTVTGHPRWIKGHDKPVWVRDHERGSKEVGIALKDYKLGKT